MPYLIQGLAAEVALAGTGAGRRYICGVWLNTKLAKNTVPPILIIVRDGCRRAHDAAWRQAVEERLLDLHIIEVVQPKPVLPCF